MKQCAESVLHLTPAPMSPGFSAVEFVGATYNFLTCYEDENLSLPMKFWESYKKISPYGCYGNLCFTIMYLFTSFCFWFFLDRHNRRDLKIQPHKQIPAISKVFWNCCFNNFIVSPLYGIVLDYLIQPEPSWEIMSIQENVMYFLLQVVSVDVIFYWTHRVCHINPIYSWVHKQHHELHSPIAFSAIYAHWFEHVFVNLSSAMIFMYVPQNIPLLIFWTNVAAFKTCQGHSGYDFGFMGKSWNYHDLHHENHKYNFGSGALMIFDRLFGTLKSREEIEALTRVSKKALAELKKQN